MKTTKRAVLLLCVCFAAAAAPAHAELKTGDQLFQVFIGPDKMVGQQRTNYDTGYATGGDYFIHAAPQVAFGVEGRFEEPGKKSVSVNTNPSSIPPTGVFPQQILKFRTGSAAALLRFNFTPKSNGTPYVLLGYSGSYFVVETLDTNLQASVTTTSTNQFWRGGGVGAVGYDYVFENSWTGGVEVRYDTYDKADQTVALLFRAGYKF